MRIPRSFTPDQERAILSPGPETLVLAPPGSGKTEVLIQRVIRMLKQSEGEAFRLLVLTFTVKAAEELRQRAQETVADELWRVDADTIHGFALDWLRRYGSEVGISPDVVVLSDDVDRIAVILGYLHSIGLGNHLTANMDASIRSLLEAIDDHRLLHAGGGCECDTDFRFPGVTRTELADAYSAALRAHGSIDFPGMLLEFRRLLDVNEWVVEHFRTLYREILIDEGQDLTAIQSDLLRRLAGDDISLFVVADDRQSIRGYAGGAFAHAKALVPAASHAPLHLRHNFRCAERILRAAEAVLAPVPADSERVEPLDNTPPGKVSFVKVASQQAEAERIVSWIGDLVESGLDQSTVAEGEDPSIALEDVCAFGRTRWTLDPVVEALTQRRIQFVVQTEPELFLPEPEARLFLDCLAFGINRNDSPAARRAADELRELTLREPPSDPLKGLLEAESSALRALARLVTQGLRGGRYLEQTMGRVLEVGDACGWPKGASTLAEAWGNYRVATAFQDRSPHGFLLHVTKMQRTRPTDPGVRLLTIDRAKGLEFKAVALLGARDGLIPHYRASSTLERNEERRRLYVAMTRATRELMVTWPGSTIDRYGRTHSQSPSPFLSEAGLLEAARTPT